MYTLSGVAAGSGIAVAKALVIKRTGGIEQKDEMFAYDVEGEADRYLKKTALFSSKLLQIVNPERDTVRDMLGAAAGFLNSKDNKEEILSLIKKGCSASMAAKTVLLENLDRFYKNNTDLKTDHEEIKNLVGEFIHNLEHSHGTEIELPEITDEVILIARNISPAQLLSLKTSLIKGVVLEEGHDSGHLGVVLRELNIPSVFGVFDATTIGTGTTVLVDGNSSVIVVEPTDDIIDSMTARRDLFADQINDESLLNITISCAVGAVNQDQEENIANYAAHGLGLLRSEFLFLSSVQEPTEDEMTAKFYKIFSKIHKNAPITARTFDFADDKKPLFTILPDDCGPLKGYGACVGTNLLKKEIRALLRASCGQEITIVFPLVTRISEKDYLKQLTFDSIRELDEAKIPHGMSNICFMIETPAAVLLGPAIAEAGAMMIIGTSSLAEYASAPCPPDSSFTPVLAKMIAMAAKSAHTAGASVGIAGRFASRAELIPLYYKLGITYIVTGAYNIKKLKSVVERLNLEHDLNPEFDEDVYNHIMNTYSGKDLSALINSLC
ncbi:MAG: putative PEP-binding protein [Succinivibrio sp.]